MQHIWIHWEGNTDGEIASGKQFFSSQTATEEFLQAKRFMDTELPNHITSTCFVAYLCFTLLFSHIATVLLFL